MRVCGKALPPRAALLLAFDFTSLVLVTPLLFMLPVLARTRPESFPNATLSLLRLMLAGVACQVIFYYSELYNLQIVRRRTEMFLHVLRAFGLLFLCLSIACLAVPSLTPALPRVLLFALALASIAVIARILALPRNCERVLVLGSGEEAAEVLETILACPEWNLEVMQILNPTLLDAHLPVGADPRLGYDRIIVAATQTHGEAALTRIVNWKLEGLPIEHAQGFLERSTGRVRIDGLTLSECIYSSKYNNGTGKRTIKRLFDIAAASTLLLLASPVMLLVAFVILLQRDGDILYRQQRVGLYGRQFSIYKFRTMRTVASASTPTWAAAESHRITPMGSFLRKYRLDELPQLVNIVKGDMSLVGPRPEQPRFCAMLAEHIPFYEQRHSVPPGLTGWAQVRYHYGSSIEESKRKLEFDLFYVKHLSLWLDCAILIETVKVVLTGRGAI